MRTRRSRIEIYFRILESVSKESLPITHIIYKTGIRYDQARHFVDTLIQLGLIDKVEREQGMSYRITENGREILKSFETIEEKMLKHIKEL